MRGAPSRLIRRKSVKTLSPKDEQKTGGTPQLDEPNKSVGSGFLNLSPRGSRIPRGIKLDEDINDVFEARQKAPPTGEGSRGKSSREGRGGSSRANRRSLPRAPAFLKGGLQRRPSGGSANTRPGVDESSKKEGSGFANSTANMAPSTGSSSSPSLSTGAPRVRVPRGRSQVNKPSRLDISRSEQSTTERKVDRSHRFSKREPMAEGFDTGEADDFDKDLFVDLDPILDAEDDFGTHSGTPTAEALIERRTLADDGPGSGSNRRRGSNRNIFNSPHFKGLVDQFGGESMSKDDSPTSGGTRSTGQKSSGSSTSLSSSRLEALDKLNTQKDGSGASE